MKRQTNCLASLLTKYTKSALILFILLRWNLNWSLLFASSKKLMSFSAQLEEMMVSCVLNIFCVQFRWNYFSGSGFFFPSCFIFIWLQVQIIFWRFHCIVICLIQNFTPSSLKISTMFCALYIIRHILSLGAPVATGRFSSAGIAN